MRRILVSGAFAIALLMVSSATAVSLMYSESEIKNEGKLKPEDALIVELEKFFEFKEITPEQIIESLPLVDDFKEELLEKKDNSGKTFLPPIQDIKESLEDMMSGSSFLSPAGNGNIEYWAVLIGADLNWYYDYFTIPFDENVKCMYNLLLASNHWEADHIKVLTNEDVTVANIVGALLWLDIMDDENDISFVYYTAHGSQLRIKNEKLGINKPIDLPPIDEEDECDEYLTTHWTGKNPFRIITDDLLNYLLNRLDSQGIAVLIDACHSGGMFDSNHQNMRVMMASCEEHELGFGILFAKYMMKGMQGYADHIKGGNGDKMVSAEEAFSYAAPLYIDYNNEFCHPVIKDEYDGELQLTELKLPPSPPSWIYGPLIGNTNILYNFSVVSTDPEGHKIRYGWDWHVEGASPEHAKVDEWSKYYESGETCNRSHLWTDPGIYDIRVKSQDEYGAERIYPETCWSDDWTTIITSEDEIIDQFQTEDRAEGSIGPWGCVCNTKWRAQSFIPTVNILSKVTLELKQPQNNPITFDIFIRNNLTGKNLVEQSVEVEPTYIFGSVWIEFDFPDLGVTPGETYYMILRSKTSHCGSTVWCNNQDSSMGRDPDSYPVGVGYVSYDSGKNWECPHSNLDHCFVTYSQGPQPPLAPTIKGPPKGVPGKEYCWTFHSYDDNGDMVRYYIDWGDGSSDITDWYPTYTPVEVCHTFADKGTFVIEAYAEDKTGLISATSSFTVVMSRTKATYNSLLLWFLDLFRNVFQTL